MVRLYEICIILCLVVSIVIICSQVASHSWKKAFPNAFKWLNEGNYFS